MTWKLLTYGMLARIRCKHLLEVRATNRQDDLVSLQQFSFAGQGTVNQVPAIVQILKAGRNIILEIVPAQRELVHFTVVSLYALIATN